MKPYSLLELKAHLSEFECLLGAQLQEIETHPKGLAILLYKKSRVWWILDLSQQTPMSLLFYEESPWRKKTPPKPLALFINSHGKNLELSKVQLCEGQGRVFHVEFSRGSRSLKMEIQLIPKAVNVLAQTEDKSISWAKPKDLAPAPQVEGNLRESTDIKAEWLGLQSGSLTEGKSLHDDEKLRSQRIEKKRRALKEVEKNLSEDETEKWRELGERLKGEDPQAVSQDWQKFLIPGASRSDMMQICFEKVKHLEKKRVGTLARAEALRKEVEALEAGIEIKREAPQRSQLKDSGTLGRTKRIGDFVFSRGKNARDNLALLRAAKSWDLWIHLKDYPGSHVILALQKNQKVPDSVLRESVIWLVQETIRSKKPLSGVKLEAVVTECRFVKPIKGDKMGRVHYQNERVLTVTLP